MLDAEQLEYINSLKRTHPNLDKEVLRKAMLESKWTEIEIMEAISIYNSADKKTEPERSETEEEEEEEEKDADLKSDDAPVVTSDRKKPNKFVSIAIALSIVLLFLVLVIVGSLVFFEMSLSEFITFLKEDVLNNILSQFN